jgi:uncharacterized pyridoxamine 5'-phosphate oxidase family protein
MLSKNNLNSIPGEDTTRKLTQRRASIFKKVKKYVNIRTGKMKIEYVPVLVHAQYTNDIQ